MKKIVLLVTMIFAIGIIAPAGLAALKFTEDKSEVDVTNANIGLVKIKSLVKTTKKLKVKIEKPGATPYTYDLNGTTSEDSYPLQSGSGTYTIKVLENLDGNRYAVIQTVTVEAKITDPRAPFRNSIVNINFTPNSSAIKTASTLSSKTNDQLAKVKSIYQYIVSNISYDKAKANKAASGQLTGYLPNIDQILSSKKGICFDYASLMAAMMRSQGIPTRMIFGYVAPKNLYHAWNEVYIEGRGWIKINGEIYFDGKSFSRMDSTFAASNNNGSLTEYLGNGKNYSVKYVY